MPALKNHLKARMAAGDRLDGIWIGSGTETAAEALSQIGFDWLLIDTEHGPVEAAAALPMLRAVSAGQTEPVVRVAWNDLVLIKRVLDFGAQTLMIPYVQSADEARAAVRATRYPPEGIRGVAGIHRAAQYGAIPDYLNRANAEIALIIQVETRAAFEALDEIAAVEGVDAIFIGPADLSASMGHLGDSNHPEVVAAIEDAAKRIKAAGKRAAILALDSETARNYAQMGYDMVAAGLDMHLMVTAARQMLEAVRKP